MILHQKLWFILSLCCGHGPLKFVLELRAEPMGWEPKNMFLHGVPEPCKTKQNLTHFEHFGSNRVGNPSGPQFVGAYALKAETHVSQDL